MTKKYPSDRDVRTEAEFDVALKQLLTNATGNGVDPRGSWVYNTNGSNLDLETVIVELQNGGPEK
ncbi:MAG: hypothetical protein ABEH88_04475 [Halobacteriales archaeon]